MNVNECLLMADSGHWLTVNMRAGAYLGANIRATEVADPSRFYWPILSSTEEKTGGSST